MRLTFAGLAAAAALALAAMPGQAATWGNAKWCAVTNNGAGDIAWECVYDSAEECQPFILGGNRGFCALSPYWQAPESTANSDN